MAAPVIGAVSSGPRGAQLSVEGQSFFIYITSSPSVTPDWCLARRLYQLEQLGTAAAFVCGPGLFFFFGGFGAADSLAPGRSWRSRRIRFHGGGERAKSRLARQRRHMISMDTGQPFFCVSTRPKGQEGEAFEHRRRRGCAAKRPRWSRL